MTSQVIDARPQWGGRYALPAPFAGHAGLEVLMLDRTPSLAGAHARAPGIGHPRSRVGNAVWMAGSALFLFAGPSAMTVTGLAFVVFQAAVVGVLAELQ